MIHTLAIIGQIIFGAYWLYNGIKHFKSLNGMTGYAMSKGVPYPKASVIVGGVLLIIGGLGIILGFYPRIAILALIIFILPVTFLMHNFWAIKDSETKMREEIAFYKNMALFGALLILWGAKFHYSILGM